MHDVWHGYSHLESVSHCDLEQIQFSEMDAHAKHAQLWHFTEPLAYDQVTALAHLRGLQTAM